MAFSIRPAKVTVYSVCFDLDIPLFVCSGLSHILSVYCIKISECISISHMICDNETFPALLAFLCPFTPPPSPSLFIANLGIVFI